MASRPALSLAISELNQALSATPRQHMELGRIIDFLRSEIAPRVRASNVHAFGSCSNGLWTPSSDADITLIVPRCNVRMKTVTKLRVVRDYMHKLGFVKGACMDIVENARIPVLKVESPLSPVPQVDLSINNISGIENSMLVKQWTVFAPAFIPLARSIKQWAKVRDINDRSKGTLSTYTLLLQIVFVMQRAGKLPRFAEFGLSDILNAPFEELNGVERPLPFNSDFRMDTTLIAEDADLAETMHAFFDTFGDASFAAGVEIVDGEIVSQPTTTGALVMRCPLTAKDVNVMSASAWQAIHSEFARARDMLNRGEPWSKIIEPTSTLKGRS